MRLFFNRLFDEISNIKWDIKFYCNFLLKPEFRKSINSNKKFRNLYSGKRCFIVGNGPSLNQLDLLKLNEEMVFTVNTIMSNRTAYASLNSDFHVIIDPFYFRQSVDLPEEKAVINLFKQINYEMKKPACIIPYEGMNSFKRYEIDKLLDLNYIYQHRNMTDSYISKISMRKNMPTSQNVIQAAIFSAIYMGFKNIYLIGCDMTSIFLTYTANDDGTPKLTNYHAYTYSDREVENILKESNRLNNEYMLYDYAKTFTIFRRIRKYAERNNIEIVNATKGGGLDIFRRIDYETLFNDI